MIGDAVSRSVIVIGSCDTQRQAVLDDASKHGQFGMKLAQALDGSADADGDGQVSADELFRYLQEQLAVVEQSPVCFQPDTRPPRLTPAAAEAVRGLLAELSRIRPSQSLDANFSQAERLCDRQPDAQLAYALVKLKAGRTGESLDAFRAVLGSHPNALVAYHAATYQHLAKKEWVPAADLLARMLEQLAANPNVRGDYRSQLLDFAGAARDFLAVVDPAFNGREAIDAAAQKLSPEQTAQYEAGARNLPRDTRRPRRTSVVRSADSAGSTSTR